MAVRSRLVPMIAVALGAAGLSAPAHAQADPLAELDRLVDTTASPRAALAVARDQIRGGDLTGATATVERLLIVHPESNDALLLHVALLCRFDERDDARLELDELAKIGVLPSAEVVQACGALQAGRGN